MKEIKNFNPRYKTFHFSLDKYTCYKRKIGICSLDNITIEELFSGSYKNEYDESSINYCRGMAKLFLYDRFTAPAYIHLYNKCGHYSCSDGQHRTCVVAKLLKKGAKVKLNANFMESDYNCQYCLIQEDFQHKENSMSIIDRIFKIKRFISIRKAKKEYEAEECIYFFD